MSIDVFSCKVALGYTIYNRGKYWEDAVGVNYHVHVIILGAGGR